MKSRNIEVVTFSARMAPADKEWLEQKVAENLTSMNAEIVRCIRFRREAEQRAVG
jgi:hypothetical protein